VGRPPRELRAIADQLLNWPQQLRQILAIADDDGCFHTASAMSGRCRRAAYCPLKKFGHVDCSQQASIAIRLTATWSLALGNLNKH